MRKKENYKLFGYDVYFSERNYSDSIALEQLYNNKISDEKLTELQKASLMFEASVQRIIDCLSYCANEMSFLKRFFFKRRLKISYFNKNIGFPGEFKEIISIIDKLEGVEPESKTSKKKVEIRANKQVE